MAEGARAGFYVFGTMRKQKLLMMLCADCTAEEAEHVLAALDPIKWIRNEVTPPLARMSHPRSPFCPTLKTRLSLRRPNAYFATLSPPFVLSPYQL